MLVEVLDKMPQAWGNKGSGLKETLKHYAAICPRLTAEELKRGLPERLGAIRSYERSHVINDIMEAANIWPSRFRSAANEEVEDCQHLGILVREGKADESILLQAVDRLFAKREISGLSYEALRGLIDADTPATRERFFRFVEEAKRPRTYQYFYRTETRQCSVPA